MSVRFDSSTDLVTYTGTMPAISSTGITVTLWAYLAVDRDNYSCITRVGSPGTVFALETEVDGAALWLFGAGGSFSSGQALGVGAWRRIAITIATNGAAVYYVAGPSGSPAVQGGSTGTATGTGLSVGGRPDQGLEWFDGRVAHERVWAAVLSQAEIEAEWASATPVRTAGLFADWPLVDHTDLTDHSGNGRHLVAGVGATTTEDDPPIETGTTGTLAGAAPQAVGALIGAVVTGGQLAGTAPQAFGALAGGVATAGQLAGAAPQAVGGLVGTVTADGALAGSAPRAVGELVGQHTTTGVLAGLAPMARGTLTDGASGAITGVRAGTPVITPPHRAGTPVLAGAVRAGIPVPG